MLSLILYKDRLEKGSINKEIVGVGNNKRQLAKIPINTSFARSKRRYETHDENETGSQVAQQVNTPEPDTIQILLLLISLRHHLW